MTRYAENDASAPYLHLLGEPMWTGLWPGSRAPWPVPTRLHPGSLPVA